MWSWTSPSLWLLAAVAATLLLLFVRGERRRRSALPTPKAARSLTRRTPPTRTRYPIVLAHGYMGFDRIPGAWPGTEYFRGIRRQLESQGHRVFVARVSPVASIAHRGLQLAAQIEKLGAERCNIIAHSMGGLDARWAIAHAGLTRRVASLTTIGTPHRGTPLADLALSVCGMDALRRLVRLIGADGNGLYDLSTRRMIEFNLSVHDAPEVRYFSLVGAVDAKAGALNALLLAAHRYLHHRAGASDGLVPVSSQHWGEPLGVVAADHWAQVGWSRSFDAVGLYLELIRLLAGRNL